MRVLNDKEKRDIFGEVLADELKAIYECVADVPDMRSTLNILNERVAVLEGDTGVIKHVVRDHSQTLQEHSQLFKDIRQDLAYIKEKVA